jgi:hypothetical protein
MGLELGVFELVISAITYVVKGLEGEEVEIDVLPNYGLAYLNKHFLT